MTNMGIQPDTVILNANVITIDPGQPRAQAVAISQGRFVAVGDTDSVSRLAGPNTKVVDLTGKTVLPGFIDAHIHVLNSGIRHVMAADCDLRSIGAIQEALREQSRKPCGSRPGKPQRESGSKVSSSTIQRRWSGASFPKRTWIP